MEPEEMAAAIHGLAAPGTTVDLAPDLAERLRAFIGNRKGGFVFQNANGGPLHQSNVLQRRLHPILANMGRGVDWKAGFHAFRRYRVTWLRKHSVPEQGRQNTGRL